MDKDIDKNATVDRHEVYILPKVAEVGNRRINLPKVRIGYTYITGNEESYFSVTGDIWNNRMTDIVCGGCGIPQYLLEKYFPHDGLLAKICDLANRWHLKWYTQIPEDAKKEIERVMALVAERSEMR